MHTFITQITSESSLLMLQVCMFIMLFLDSYLAISLLHNDLDFLFLTFTSAISITLSAKAFSNGYLFFNYFS